MMAQGFITNGGIDFARSLLEKALGNQKAIDIINRLTSSLQVRPFDFVRRTDPAQLLNFIQGRASTDYRVNPLLPRSKQSSEYSFCSSSYNSSGSCKADCYHGQGKS
jgi:hypothetical protein